jgi:acyl-CoA dehydrogenase
VALDPKNELPYPGDLGGNGNTLRESWGDLLARANAAAEVAAAHADEVDRTAAFPDRAVSALRKERLLGMMVPREHGGEGATVSDVAEICYLLGRSCASTAMIFAMHQIMVAILVRHALSSAWHQDLLRSIAERQLLLASSTTEAQRGGDVRSSDCAVQADGPDFALVKSATVISYGGEADGLLTTARRAPDAPPSDQVIVALLHNDYKLKRTVGWDVLGMRGTCSTGFLLESRGKADQIVPEPYQRIHTRTMVPVAHLTWSSVWAGVAHSAVQRAQSFTRTAARRAGGKMPPGAVHLSRAFLSLNALRATLSSALREFEAIGRQPSELDTTGYQTSINLLKVNTSELAIATVTSAMQACGLSGYRNDGEFSVTRALRDVLSSSIMINNDRIVADLTSSLAVAEMPSGLREAAGPDRGDE